jgi:cytochrome c oxidase subunit 2
MIDTGRVYVPSIAALVLVLAGAATGRAESSPNQQPREIKMIARKFAFVPKQVTVQKGERIRLLLTSEDVDHGIAIKAFDIDQVVKAKETKAIEFTADKEGKFEFFCSVFCGDGHPDMVGEVIVTSGRGTKSASSNFSVRFDDATPGVVIVEAGGEQLRIDTTTQSVTTLAADEAAHEVLVVPEPIPETGKPLHAIAQGDPKTAREPYDYLVVNVPTPKRVPRRSLNLHFTHRFQQSFWPLDESANDLFGLDNTAVAAFGFSYGFTDRLYGRIYRSPLCRTGLCRTIEMGVGYHWLDEAGRSPLALSTYASVEGDDNFRHDYTWNLQAMVGRSITKYVNAFFSPAVHINSNGNGRFNPRPEATPFPDEVSQLRLGQHTGSFGFGFNGRVRPSFSLVFDYTPRVGFKMGRIVPVVNETTGELIELRNESEAGLGFGFEKRTARHVFTLTFSNTQTTTTARYNSSNLVLPPSKVTIGFNIYRRLL